MNDGVKKTYEHRGQHNNYARIGSHSFNIKRSKQSFCRKRGRTKMKMRLSYTPTKTRKEIINGEEITIIEDMEVHGFHFIDE